MAEVSNAVPELVVSGYYISPRAKSDVPKHPCCDDKVGMVCPQVLKEGLATILE